MGHYLTTPIKEKNTITGRTETLEYTASSMQGWRLTMEDAHITHPNFDKDVHLFAVFDGHGGHEVAKYCEKHFGRILKSSSYYQRKSYSEALKHTFLQLDVEMQSLEGKKDLKRICDKDEEFGGCTANVVLIVGQRVYISNAGDSRSVLYSESGTEKLSFDHKPEDKIEFDRITKAGGFVMRGRVCGNLNLSRALGDFDFKGNSNLPAEEQMISAMPDVVVRELKEGDKFLVMGCDGVWELMTDNEVCQVVKEGLEAKLPIEEVVEEVLDKGIAEDVTSGLGCDNMSCVVIRLDKLI